MRPEAASPSVQGDTSTTMAQPLDEIGAICRRARRAALRRRHRVARRQRSRPTPGGSMPRPPGCRSASPARRAARPITFNERVVEVIDAAQARRGAASARPTTSPPTAPRIQSNYFDLAMLMDYWGDAPAQPPHRGDLACSTPRASAPASCSREGLDEAFARHALPAAAMLAGLRGLGLELFGDVAHKMTNVVGVEIPDGVDGDAVRARAAATTSASRSARRSARCTAGSGASARWATTAASRTSS